MKVSQRTAQGAAIVAILGLVAISITDLFAPAPEGRTFRFYWTPCVPGVVLLFLRMGWLRAWCGPRWFTTHNTFILKQKACVLLYALILTFLALGDAISAAINHDGEGFSDALMVFATRMMLPFFLLGPPILVYFLCVVNGRLETTPPTAPVEEQRLQAEEKYNIWMWIYTTVCFYYIVLEPHSSKEDANVWNKTIMPALYCIVTAAVFVIGKSTEDSQIEYQEQQQQQQQQQGIRNEGEASSATGVEPPSTDYQSMV